MASATSAKKPRRKRRKVNKSELVRAYLADHPEAAPKEISTALKEKHRINVSAQLISNLKTRTVTKGTRKKVGGPKGTDSVSISGLLDAKKLVDQLGSVEKVRQALEALSKLR